MGWFTPVGKLPAGIMPAEFSSPVSPAYQNKQLTADQFTKELQSRQKTSVRTVKGKFKLYAGTRTGMGTQSFDVLYGIDRPKQNLRLRAGNTYGTLFDILVQGNRFVAVNYPDKTRLSGTVQKLREKPALTAGLEPTMLFDAADIQDTLLTRLTNKAAEVKIRTNAEGYRFDVKIPGTADTERFEVRRADLLVSSYTRYRDKKFFPDKKLFSVDYLTYKGGTAGIPLHPTAFTVSGKTGQIGIIVNEAEVNGQLPPAIFVMQPGPSGFKEAQL